MTARSIQHSTRLLGLLALPALWLWPEVAEAQVLPEIFKACYMPNTGVVYRIDAPDAPPECKSANHVEFDWTDGLPGHDHGNLNGLADDDHPQYLLVDGTRALTGDLSMGGNRLTGLAAATTAGDAVRFEQAVKTGDAAGGDLGGTYPNPTVVGLQDNAVAATAPSDGQVLSWDDATSQWAPVTPPMGVTDHGALTGLTDDDHSQYVLVNGVRNATDGFAVTGAVSTGTIPTTGAGVRLMWYPGKAAFRVGRATGNQWDDANIGFESAAMGVNTTASGRSSTAMGNGTTASGIESTAMGLNTVASGEQSTAMGNGTTASRFNSTAMGSNTTASGFHSTAMGNGTTATGVASTAMGNNTVAQRTFSTAMGDRTTASGAASTAMGSNTLASGAASTAMGASTSARGGTSTAMGSNTHASGTFSTAMGSNASTNLHDGSFVYGDHSTSSIVNVSADNSFVVRAAGGTIFYSNSGLTAGVSLAAGAGSWASVSDRNRKENFRDEDGEIVLEKIAGMPIQSWSYKSQAPSIRHVGPTSQDFYAAFGLGESDTTITTTDIDGVNILAIQTLERRTRDLRDQLEAKHQEITRLRADIDALRQRLERVEGTREGEADSIPEL